MADKKEQTLEEYYEENKKACDSNGQKIGVSGLDFARSIYKAKN